MNNSLNTRGQMLIALELLKNASDMRMSHRRRASMIRYAREVIGSLPVEITGNGELYDMLCALEEHANAQEWSHTDIKRVVSVVATSLEVRIEAFEVMRPDAPSAWIITTDDIPF